MCTDHIWLFIMSLKNLLIKKNPHFSMPVMGLGMYLIVICSTAPQHNCNYPHFPVKTLRLKELVQLKAAADSHWVTGIKRTYVFISKPCFFSVISMWREEEERSQNFFFNFLKSTFNIDFQHILTELGCFCKQKRLDRGNGDNPTLRAKQWYFPSWDLCQAGTVTK